MANQDINAFFTDLDASSVISLKAQQIAAPMVAGSPMTLDELMQGGGIRIVMHIFDRSPSMKPVARLFHEDFNQEYVPAIQAAREDDIAALRLGGISFSSDIRQIWNDNGTFFHPLENLPPLTKTEYDPQNGGGTALHEAMLQGYALALRYAQEVQAEFGTQPEIDIVVLTDGANNEKPKDPSVVKKVIKGSDQGLVRFVFFYFETAMGLDNPAKYAVNELGFDPENVMTFALDSNETEAERQKRFRRMLRVMSRVSASKGTSAVKAAAVDDLA